MKWICRIFGHRWSDWWYPPMWGYSRKNIDARIRRERRCHRCHRQQAQQRRFCWGKKGSRLMTRVRGPRQLLAFSWRNVEDET